MELLWKLKRILLCHPPSGLYRRDDRCQSKVDDQTVRVVLPPLDLAYHAAVLERLGCQCKIADYPSELLSWEDFEKDVRDFRPDMLLISATYPTLASDLQAAERLKAVLPECLTVARGEVFSVWDELTLQKYPALDMVLTGETELSLAALVDGRSPVDIPGLTYRYGEQMLRGPEPELITDLDALPFPSRHLLKNHLYRSPDSNQLLTTIHAARGCPSECIFCPVGRVSGSKIRVRSPENILEEIQECVEKYHIKDFLFHADTFTYHKRWLIELCRLIADQDLGIRWGCNSRVDTIDEERVFWMKRAGCWIIGFGVESGDEQSLLWMRKNATLDQARKAVNLCRKYGVRSHAFFMFGFPWDTKETIRKTLSFARDLSPDFFDFNIAFPLPGTPFYDMAVEEGLLVFPEGEEAEGYAKAIVRTRTLSPEDLERWRAKALWRLYLRPGYILRTLWKTRSLPVAWNYIKAAFRRGRGLMKQKKTQAP